MSIIYDNTEHGMGDEHRAMSYGQNTPAEHATPSHRYAVIMCGGIGSRFWPYSRQDRPKQFIDFFGTGRSLLQMTADRLRYIVPMSNIIVVTNDRYLPLVQEQLPDIPRHNILCEPARRNTAPCVAWAAHHIYARDPEATMIVAASDHLITRERDFEAAILRAFEFVEQRDALLTLGIVPSRPETGYGYIQQGERVDTAEGVFAKVKTFTEKPDKDLARVFVESGEFFWNSGIFVWTAEAILTAMRTYAPEVAAVFDNTAVSFAKYEEEDAFIAANFATCPSISIDYAVMEKAQNVYVERVDFGWNDLGTWSALYDNSPKNRDANVTQRCAVLAYNSTGNIFAVNGDKLIVCDSLRDYIVADSGDVLLICPKSEEQRIKQMVNDAKIAYGDKYL